MKKLVLLLLILLLPIQYSWSVAAVYCQHEPGKSAHFGHHGHQHQAQADDAKSKPSKLHGDCEVCHHAVQATLPAAGAVTASPPAMLHVPREARRFHSYIADGPPRPNWPVAA